ncbi:hypothetical protein N836_00140 [Leptolyngbya sp. Heron Island J]|uniref:hypothetical protein n=1 Tax=Leptolyngbya sp. Heron Island J TaxID=1385935 RepID=UPI0003B9A97E|nr:hypothetical protein [Leptolyngbya sp. Heron Island J]ESA37123.1 hypothetical protein N836_00140 [Leptolyngbya sp. Heron Island J]
MTTEITNFYLEKDKRRPDQPKTFLDEIYTGMSKGEIQFDDTPQTVEEIRASFNTPEAKKAFEENGKRVAKLADNFLTKLKKVNWDINRLDEDNNIIDALYQNDNHVLVQHCSERLQEAMTQLAIERPYVPECGLEQLKAKLQQAKKT